MANIIIAQDTESLIDSWLEAEVKGEKFPVPFDLAWQIAGYSTKANGKRKLNKLQKEVDFSSDLMKNRQRGRSEENLKMTCDAFKHFCLMAETEEGRNIRQYFVEAEKKWRIVQQQFSEVAEEVEAITFQQHQDILSKQIKLEELKAQAIQSELALVQFRHLITSTCPEPVQQKVLGYQVVEHIEYRDRIIKDDQLINDGSTINKTTLCRRYGILTKNGKPDYKTLNHYLSKMPNDSFTLSAVIQENQELRRDFLSILDRLVEQSDRQMWFGEN